MERSLQLTAMELDGICRGAVEDAARFFAVRFVVCIRLKDRQKGPPSIMSRSAFEIYTKEQMVSAAFNPACQPLGAEANGALSVAECKQAGTEKLALVIPTLCEAGNIGGLLLHVRSILDPLNIPYEILVVDDDSNDGTGDVVTAIARDDQRVRLIVRKGMRGLSGAVLYGWEHTDAPVLGVMDADLQHPPELLPELLAAVHAGNCLAIGSRYTPGGELGSWNPFRKMLSAAAVWVTLPLQKRKLRAKDPMSGFFMVRRRCLERVAFQPTGFKLLP